MPRKKTGKARTKAPRIDQVRDAMIEDLKRSGLDDPDIYKSLGYKPLVRSRVHELIGKQQCGYGIPYRDLLNVYPKRSKFYRVRFLEEASGFNRTKPQRYSQPASKTPRTYLPDFPDLFDWQDIARDHKQDLYICEAEKKAACVAHNTNEPAIGLGGVWNWTSKNNSTVLLPCLEAFTWKQRDTFIVFDNDARTNDSVHLAMHRLASTLTNRGANVYIVELPEGPLKGVDDLICGSGIEAFYECVDVAQENSSVGEELWQLNDQLVHVDALSRVFYLDSFERSVADGENINCLHSYTNVRNAMANRIAREGSAEIPLFPAWLKWPLRRNCASITYQPGEERFMGERLNVYAAPQIEPVKGSVDVYYQFLELMLGARKFDRYGDYLLWWLANLVARPATRPITAVILYGEQQGTGKSSTFRMLEQLINPLNFVSVTPGAISRFTGHLSNKLLMVIDEAITHDFKALESDLKHIITEDRLRVEHKGIDPYWVPNYLRVGITSNSDLPIRLHEHDRRYFALETRTDPEVAGQMRTFMRETFLPWFNHDDGAAKIMNHFQHGIDHEQFSPYEAPPATEDRASIIAAGKSPLHAALCVLVEDADLYLRNQCDMYTAQQIAAVLYENSLVRYMPSPQAVARELRSSEIHNLGVRPARGYGENTNRENHFTVSARGRTKTGRWYILRNYEEVWRAKSIDERREHIARHTFKLVGAGVAGHSNVVPLRQGATKNETRKPTK